MPGIAKRKYIGELMRFNKSLKAPLNKIYDVLPCEYDGEILFKYFKILYPHLWKEMKERYQVYKSKDEFLIKNKKKKRYNPLPPKKYFFSLQKVKHLLSNGQKIKHKNNCNDSIQKQKFFELKKIRDNKIHIRKEKIKKYKETLQKIDPLFIDILVNFYHKRGNSVYEKMEIVKEMQKYDSKKVIEFFYKLNDSERNNQIRKIAFKHLQKLGYYVKLRKNFKGKKKNYMLERTKFHVTPQELFEKIENKKTIQHLKKYDCFISHSYLDYELIVELKNKLNKKGYRLYIDWSSDNDFLKRHLSDKYKNFVIYVLQKRIEQSNKVLFVLTHHSKNKSWWIKQELNYAKKINKKILCINYLKEKCKFEEFLL